MSSTERIFDRWFANKKVFTQCLVTFVSFILSKMLIHILRPLTCENVTYGTFKSWTVVMTDGYDRYNGSQNESTQWWWTPFILFKAKTNVYWFLTTFNLISDVQDSNVMFCFQPFLMLYDAKEEEILPRRIREGFRPRWRQSPFLRGRSLYSARGFLISSVRKLIVC